MAPRFFSSQPLSDRRAELRGTEAHHLVHVRRFQLGDTVELFDAQGTTVQARIDLIDSQHVGLEILHRMQADGTHPPLILGVAFPKGERQKWMVEKCVELGVTTLVPIRTQRSVAIPTESAVERWQRQIIAACKQSGRGQIMDVAPPVSLRHFLETKPADSLPLFADASGEPWHHILAGKSPLGLIAAIGPEGGWSPDELQLARDLQWHIVRLGPHTLRVETAAIAMAALSRSHADCS